MLVMAAYAPDAHSSVREPANLQSTQTASCIAL